MGTDSACGALRLLGKTVDDTVKVRLKREDSSTLRVRHGCLHTHAEIILTSFAETFLLAAQ